MNFKAGDKVIRTWDDFHSIVRGGSYEVEATPGTNLRLVGHTGVYVAAAFSLAQAASGEQDPNGLDQHAPGAKVDAGKIRPSLILLGMARALWAVSTVATKGAAKYTDGGWVLVPNGEARYEDADLRHMLRRAMGEERDPDTDELHLAHEAWNALAKLDLHLRNKEQA